MSKKLGITDKLSLLIVVASLLPLLVMDGQLVWMMLNMRDKVVSTATNIGAETVKKGMKSSENRARQNMEDIATRDAKIVDRNLLIPKGHVTLLAETMTNIYSKPKEYPPRKVSEPQKGKSGLSIQLMFSPYVKNRQNLANEISLAANIQDLLFNISKFYPDVNAACVATETGFIIEADEIAEQKFHPTRPRVLTFDVWKRPWYKKAKEKGELTVSEVFDDYYGGGKSIAISAPFYRDGQFAGVVAVSYSLGGIVGSIEKLRLNRTGYSFIVGPQGKLVMSLKTEGELSVPGKGTPPDLRLSNNSEQVALIEKMLSWEKGFFQGIIDGKDVYLAYVPLAEVPWSLAVVREAEEVLRPVRYIQGEISRIAEQNKKYMNDEYFKALWFLIVVHLLALMAALLAARATSGRLIRPIRKLTRWTSLIGQGDFGTNLEVKTGDEIEGLVDALNQMRTNLAAYIDNQNKIVTEREHVLAESRIAKKIQQSLLPGTFPPFSGRHEFDLYASMLPAREVGGDFYDFFLVDENHLVVVVVEVSSKGLPAALRMLTIKALVTTQARLSSSDFFAKVYNNIFSESDPDTLRMVFLGILEIDSGRFSYLNASHAPPLISYDGHSFDWLPVNCELDPLALKNKTCQIEETVLPSGAILFLYTDGIMKTLNSQGSSYSNERLRLLLDSGLTINSTAQELTEAIEEDIRKFSSDAEMAEDRTIFVLKVI